MALGFLCFAGAGCSGGDGGRPLEAAAPARTATQEPSFGAIDWAGLPRRQWVRVPGAEAPGWRRQPHAGVAYDSKRGRLVVFGSDTHNTDWDNTVHVYDPAENRWSTLGRPAPPKTYRADARGRAVCGEGAPRPWAMHTFDNIVYDPTTDALVVTAVPDHNPARERVRGIEVHPTWFYRFGPGAWEMFENGAEPSPTFFAGGSAYDAGRDTIVAYGKSGVWELGPDRRVWRRATKERHHEIHFITDFRARFSAKEGPCCA